VPLTRGNQALALSSGRSIGSCVYGDPAGKVVLNCDGGLVSGHDAEPSDANATALGLCIVSPDRPGVGRTDRLSAYGMIPWVQADDLPLLEHHQIAEFAVMRWSEGGQYPLAVAHELPGRVTRCALAWANVLVDRIPGRPSGSFHSNPSLDIRRDAS
jgi:pimeloyl-ACP methyl ester carboxylesterase